MTGCNATGVYSGVVADSNGNPDDASNLDETWLRGIQPTSADGISTFKTIFPVSYCTHAFLCVTILQFKPFPLRHLVEWMARTRTAFTVEYNSTTNQF